MTTQDLSGANADALERRIAALEEELRENKMALMRLHPDHHTLAEPRVHPGKRGYLFKWLDRSIGWTGTKWALRFVTLENGHLSTFASHLDSSPRYTMALRGCAVRDDGWKLNRRHRSGAKGSHQGSQPPFDEPGAYFFVFSVYNRPDVGQDDADITPLLRFSTTTLAEKTQWIQRISEACEYCESDAFAADEARRMQEQARQMEEQTAMASAMPEASKGTLPPLYFAPAAVPKRRPRRSSKKLFRTTSRNLNADDADARSTKGYPPSKPMHRTSAPSYLSAEAPVQNYRGFFNLGIILLVVSNFRLILGRSCGVQYVLAFDRAVVSHPLKQPCGGRGLWSQNC